MHELLLSTGSPLFAARGVVGAELLPCLDAFIVGLAVSLEELVISLKKID